ncbi:hypothetical protein DFJ74DRAFT_710756 [Hyaloraphidium curvatum]|nr:hypothetical protein DFJ74DRAFT_710756 [Hyaloraphidium curvatum]
MRFPTALAAGAAAALALLSAHAFFGRPEPPRAAGGPPRIAACAVVRDASADLPEWLAYHRGIGVSRFLVFDDGSRPPLRIDAPDVEVSRVAGTRAAPGEDKPPFARTAQGVGYARCAVRCADFDWMLFVDPDEFVMLRSPRPSLPQFLSRPHIRDASAVCLNWIVFAAPPGTPRSANGTLAGYSRCAGPGFVKSSAFKAVANCRHLVGMASPHNPTSDLISPFNTREQVAAPVAVHHYMYRSDEEVREKLAKGGADGKVRTEEERRLAAAAANATCDYLQRRVRKCCPLVMDWDSVPPPLYGDVGND